MPTPASAPHLDPFSVVVLFATSFGVTGDAASILGAYSVILLSAFGGAAWSASGMPDLTRLGIFLHILLMMGLALVGTIPLAELISHVTNVEIRWLLAPLAILIAARPDWVLRTLRRWFNKRAGLDDEPMTPTAKEKLP